MMCIMLKRKVSYRIECYVYYGIEKYTFRRKISDFGEDFSYLQSFFNDNFIHALVIDHSQGMGGVTFHNSVHRLALCHANDMRCLGTVHAPANYR